jgi:hypothetical protein
MLDERLRHHVVLWCHAKEAAMTQAEVEAAISLLAEQIAKLQEKQGKHTQDWRRLATLSGWLSVTCVWLGAIFAVAMLVIGFNFYMMVAISTSLFMLASAPLGILSRALWRTTDEPQLGNSVRVDVGRSTSNDLIASHPREREITAEL